MHRCESSTVGVTDDVYDKETGLIRATLVLCQRDDEADLGEIGNRMDEHHIPQQLPDSTTATNGELLVTIISDEKLKLSIWWNWKFLAMACAILAYNTMTGVADQQISKEINSSVFQAPFLLLWYMGIVRTFTFPVYVVIRTTYEFFVQRHNSKTTTEPEEAINTNFSSILGRFASIYREAETVFGASGLTLKTGASYLVPFALLWTSTNGLFYWALTFAEVSECVAVSSSTMIFMYLISWTFLKENFILFKFFGVLICVAGVVLTVLASGTTIGASSNSLIAGALVISSSLSLAVQTVGFKRYLGSPTVCQIALFSSLGSFANAVLTWPVFLSLKLTGNELWDLRTAPFGLMSLTGVLGSTGALSYYLGVSIVSPIFISLSKPLQIMTNNVIDIAIKGIPFGLYHMIGAGLVITGFLMLLIPNTLVSLEIRTFILKLRPSRKASAKEVELTTIATANYQADETVHRETKTI
ncbi:hypothetical protein BV898_09217 [Hypsibius exemplaris]|uniref:EamA domain-containing protein n=1 Tax=Hypsibius exemplaris TaxID=2072580 RepID=A0A1W0WNH0_HYPEX|nr:hypothetical protein BV898_09217 [Hypsibius exemplaris]